MNVENMTISELIQFVDLYSRCRDNMFRRDVLFNIRKFYSDDKTSADIIALDKKYVKRDKEFRNEVRKLLKSIIVTGTEDTDG